MESSLIDGGARKARRKAWWHAVVLVPLMAAAPAALAQNTLVVAAVTTPKGLDGDVFLPGSVEAAINVYEGLTDYARIKDAATGRERIDATKLVPHLAESWTLSPDGTIYVMKLRNAKSPSGNELNADDLVFTFEKSSAQKRTGLFLLTVSTVDKVEKVSDKEVRFTLKAPNRSFLNVLQLYAPSVYDSKTVKTHATAADPFALEWVAQNTAGYGAYTVQSLRPGEGATFAANPNYFGPKPFYDRVAYREVPSPANRAALVKSGAAQWAENVPIQAILDLQKDPNVKVEREQGTAPAIVWMNAKYKPFDDARVRKAMLHATDYDAINKTVFLGIGTRSRSFLSPMMAGYQPLFQYETDYAKAKQLLAEAGYPNGVEVTMEYSDLYWWEEGVALQLQQSMQNAGIKVTPKRLPATEMRQRYGVGQRTLPMHTNTNVPYVMNAGYGFFLNLHTRGSGNYSGYVSPKMDGLIDQITVERDDAKYNALVAEAQKLYVEDAPGIETFYPGFYAVMAPCVHGWVWRPVNYVYFRDLRCEPKRG